MIYDIYDHNSNLIRSITGSNLQIRLMKISGGFSADKHGGYGIYDGPYIDSRLLAVVPSNWAIIQSALTDK